MALFSSTTRASQKNLYNWLDRAAREGDADEVRAALDAGANVNPSRREGRAPLSPAIRSGSIETVRLLLDRGADPNYGETRWHSPLHFALNSGSLEMVRLLIEREVQVNPKVIQTKPLMFAAALGHEDIVHCLLDAGADVTAVDGKGRTALDWAQAHGREEVAQLLRRAGEGRD